MYSIKMLRLLYSRDWAIKSQIPEVLNERLHSSADKPENSTNVQPHNNKCHSAAIAIQGITQHPVSAIIILYQQ